MKSIIFSCIVSFITEYVKLKYSNNQVVINNNMEKYKYKYK